MNKNKSIKREKSIMREIKFAPGLNRVIYADNKSKVNDDDVIYLNNERLGRLSDLKAHSVGRSDVYNRPGNLILPNESMKDPDNKFYALPVKEAWKGGRQRSRKHRKSRRITQRRK